MVRIRCFHCQGPGSIPDGGTKISQGAQPGQKKKKGKIDDRRKDRYQEAKIDK